MRLEGQETREENILGITELTIMKMGDGEKKLFSGQNELVSDDFSNAYFVTFSDL